MDIEKSSFLSCSWQPLPYQGRLHQSVTIGLGFGLVHNLVLPADQTWAAVIAHLPDGWCIDTGIPKKYAEWLLAGSARSAGKTLQSQMFVEIEVGLSKRCFSMHGHYQEDGTPPFFNAMPLVWENTYGYARCPDNPVGHGECIHPNGRVYLPELCDAHDGTSIPACPGPRGAWPCRMQNMGSYDSAWLQSNWPGLPEDCDWSFYNLAQPAQWLPSGLQGDEQVRLSGVHHDHPVLHFRLPGKKVRVLVEYTALDKPQEMTPVLDTLWLFPDALTGLLLWHVLVPCLDETATDIKLLRLEMTPLEPEGQAEAPDEPQIPYKLPEAEWRNVHRSITAQDRTLVSSAESAAVQQAFTDVMKEVETLSQCGGDVASLLARLKPGADASGGNFAGQDLSGLDLTGVDFSNAKLMDVRFAGSILRAADFSGADMTGVDLNRANLDGASLCGATLVKGLLRDVSAVEAVFAEADLSQADMCGMQAIGADFAGCVMEGTILRLACCSGANFSGVMATGIDAQGGNFNKATVRESNFSKAVFTGAQLREAAVFSSMLDEAVFQNADCSKASFGGTTTLRNSDFSQALLTDGEWEGVQAEGGIFTRAQTSGTRFIACNFTQSSWQACVAIGADFSRSRLCQADMRQANMLKASFREAMLQGADCTGANLYGADFYRCGFDMATRMHNSLLGNTLLTLAGRG